MSAILDPCSSVPPQLRDGYINGEAFPNGSRVEITSFCLSLEPETGAQDAF